MGSTHNPLVQVTISLRPLQSQHINVPLSVLGSNAASLEKTPSRAVFRVTRKKQSFYFSWSGGVSSAGRTIEVDSAVAAALGLNDGDRAAIELLPNVQVAASVNVEPLSPDDWEIIELNAELLETEFLRQCRVVSVGQILLVWARKQTVVRLRVVSMAPEAPVLRLDNDCEIIIAPITRAAAIAAPAEPSEEVATTDKLHKRGISARVIRLEDITTPSSAIQSQNEPTLFLGVPSSSDTPYKPCKSSLKQLYGYSINSQKYVRIVPWNQIPSSDASAPDSSSTFGRGKFNVAIIETDRIPAGSVAISKWMRDSIGLQPYQRIRLMIPTNPPTPTPKLVLRKHSAQQSTSSIHLNSTDNESVQDLPSLFRDFLDSKMPKSKSGHLTLSSNTSICIDSDTIVTIQILPHTVEQLDTVRNDTWATIHESELSNLEIVQVVTPEVEPVSTCRFEDDVCPLMGGVEKETRVLEKLVRSRMEMQTLRRAVGGASLGGVLVHGNQGLGKTTLVQRVLYSLGRDISTLAYSQVVSCAALKDKKSGQIKDSLSRAFASALFQAPSVLVLDDLDLIAPANAENADALGSRQIAEHLIPLIRKYCIHGPPGAVTVVATAIDKQSIHPRFLSSHTLADFVHITAPNRNQRADILKVLLAKESGEITESIDTSSIATLTEGYRPTDLETLVSRASHAAAIRRIKSTDAATNITYKDIESALSGYTPPLLKGLKPATSTALGWSSIGGLHEPKKMLIETLEWPTRYAPVFASCPLRLRSGILLYGYPGCGKTILAAAVAKECGLNFISVKGPEILNKYIGESEKSVRDLFDRAQSAKPCILFFDEFDSIAPRRGNDNTGVTDRVVNQLLTQMDGAEGLDGVYVLAATSRPDLIDPALLRPGRLDKSVCCGMPDLDERIEILEAVSQTVTLSSGVDLRAVAEQCVDFTGADLQGLVYSAQLEAIHEQIDEPLEEKSAVTKAGTVTEFKVVQPVKAGVGEMVGAERTRLRHRIETIHENIASPLHSAGTSNAKATKTSTIIVEQYHFEAALKTSRASLTPQEKQRFDRVFSEFSGADEETVAKEIVKRMGKKSTMA
ncbi:Peroxisome biosynthesis protein pex1 [Rhizoclosmatium sp. JEL0117]|nr:Peroxisome biosynthesis protein pex1 [Rhizoclosmatium sp. JEL0117]